MKKVVGSLFIVFVIAITVVFYPADKNEFREPASKKPTRSCLSLLKGLYTHQSSKNVEKVAGLVSNDPHMFYRSFPPYYYTLISRLNWQKAFGEFSDVQSVILGDAHMENFGLKFVDGKLRFIPNDFDDLTKAPLALDLVRLIVSAKLAGAKVNKELLGNFIENYAQGLSGDIHTYSKYVDDLVEKSNSRSMFKDDYVDLANQRFLTRKEPNQSIKAHELAKWSQKLENLGTIKDSYLYLKDTGGSAGMKRFQFLMEINGELRWMEAKEWTIPSYNSALEITPPQMSSRFEWLNEFESPELAHQLLDFDGSKYLIRTEDYREVGVGVGKLDKDELADVLLDEAFSLGDFHRQYLSNPDEVKGLLERIDLNEVDDVADKLEKDVRRSIDSKP